MILEIGKIPPPIGGISIHIQRIIRALEKSNVKIELFDYSKDRNIAKICIKIYRCNAVHLHLSRKLLRLFFVIFFRLISKKIILTYHGKYDFKNLFDLLSLKLSTFSILLNPDYS